MVGVARSHMLENLRASRLARKLENLYACMYLCPYLVCTPLTILYGHPRYTYVY
jgi:hypothetical protein